MKDKEMGLRMKKTIELNYNNQTYTLEFTRRTVESMQNAGFVVQDLLNKSMVMIPMLVRGAFAAHHRFLRPDQIDAIYENGVKNKSEFLSRLVDMYQEPIQAMLVDEDEEDGDEKNVGWTANW